MYLGSRFLELMACQMTLQKQPGVMGTQRQTTTTAKRPADHARDAPQTLRTRRVPS
ncbi:uncharacterized protein SEPMUDRAFT_147147 [Sphaerulina musiva SO2202]|uniref:Uncharacterized protein n=1 Tax=Sphaerulina musiva (strain SO2202) TaxID=692275 RepID=M3C4J1_SPHMS|nr:uncharacterized protein SEPMUDRAFT_147147 [Sphaerulina musiva SO2202]EMF15216.1 hypothetical protein SEPMUDRAFT_147147 [Sphaerulina musiva SO2202]